MMSMIKKKYYWPGMFRDVKKYVATCRSCLLAKAAWRPKMGLIGDFGLEPGKFDHLHVDHVGPLGVTKKGNLFVLSMIDRATGWTECIGVPDKGMETAAEEIYNRWFMSKGVPLVITTDNAFKNQLMAELAKRCGYRESTTSVYHPQSNAKVERI